MEKTNILRVNDGISHLLYIVDKDDNIIKYVYEYNNLTKEALIYVKDENGKIKTELIDPNNPDGEIRPVMERKILEGSRLMFKVKNKMT